MSKNEFVSKLKEMGYEVEDVEGEIYITKTAYHHDYEFPVLFATVEITEYYTKVSYHDEIVNDELYKLLAEFTNKED